MVSELNLRKIPVNIEPNIEVKGRHAYIIVSCV